MPALIYVIITVFAVGVFSGVFIVIRSHVKNDNVILNIRIISTWLLFFTFFYFTYEFKSHADIPGEGWFILKRLILVSICLFGFPLILPDIMIMISKQLNDSGKQWIISILTAMLTYFIITFSQFVSDYAIRAIIQTNPDQFPGAQRALTVIFSIPLWFSIFIIISFVFLTYFAHSKSKSLKSITGTATGLFFIIVVIPDILYLSSASGAFLAGKQEMRSERSTPILIEQIIIWSSFTENSLPEEFFPKNIGDDTSDDKRFCSNIPEDNYVSPVSPDDVIPNKVVVAELRKQNIPNNGLQFTYRLASCENSNNPDRVE